MGIHRLYQAIPEVSRVDNLILRAQAGQHRGKSQRPGQRPADPCEARYPQPSPENALLLGKILPTLTEEYQPWGKCRPNSGKNQGPRTGL